MINWELYNIEIELSGNAYRINFRKDNIEQTWLYYPYVLAFGTHAMDSSIMTHVSDSHVLDWE